MISIALPITLCRRIELVAESKNIDFSQAVSFLLEKVEAPFISAWKGGSTRPDETDPAGEDDGAQDKEAR